jgi:uncharacterized protein (TIGR02099 family)
MPSPRASSRASGASAALVARVVRIAGVAALGVVVVFCALLLSVRYVVFPRVNDYRDDLEAALTRQLGQPVEIDRLDTGWDGWNPKLVVHGLRVHSGADPGSPLLVDLPQAELVVSWTSVVLLDVRLKQLTVERPRLAIRRDQQGLVHVAGMEFDPSRLDADVPLTEWLLRQPHIEVRDAFVSWSDDQRGAPQLALNHVQLRLESRFGRHRFGLRGAPPPQLSAPVDVRGDVRRGPNGDWTRATGTIYVRLDYADIAAWTPWLPLPAPVTRGEGAARLWFEFAGGEPTEAVADVELANVRTRLRPDLAELDLARLSGRIGWRTAPPRREYYTRALAIVTARGERVDPTSVAVTLRAAGRGGVATGLVEFDRLQLGPLRELVRHLPLPEDLRGELARYAPRGTLTRGRVLWEGRGDAPDIFSAATDFSDLGVAAQGELPGVDGLTGHVEMTQATGDVTLASTKARLDLPRIFATPIALDRVSAALNWTRTAERTAVQIERLEFANQDAAGHATGTYRTMANGPGEIDLTAQLSRASVAAAYRYLPRAIAPPVHDWVRSALTKGTSNDVRLRLSGNLADFPFASGKGGQFSVVAKGHDVVVDYFPGWPAVTDLDGEFDLDGARIAVAATRGRVAGVDVGSVKAGIDDLRAENPRLTIAGAVAAPTSAFLRFIDTSPVAGLIDRVTDGAQASGDGRLDLKLEFPLGDPAGNRVTGTYRLVDNGLKLAGVPPLSRVNGTLAFTESGVHAEDLTLSVLGGPARLTVASVEGETRISGGGSATVEALRREFDPPFGDALAGSLDWTLAASARHGGTTWTVQSNLQGCAIDLPAPLAKSARDAVALKIERQGVAGASGEDIVALTYGGVGRLFLHRRLAADGATVDRALALVGAAADAQTAAIPDQAGVWVRGDLPALDVDDWLALERHGGADSAATPAGALRLSGIDLSVKALDAFGRRFNDITVNARREQDDWRLELSARELAGTATWSAPSADARSGRLRARLSRLLAPDEADDRPHKAAADDTAKAPPDAANRWPMIDVIADTYLVHGRGVGKLEFYARPRGSEWRIDKLTLTNDSGQIAAQGQWQPGGRDEQTKLDVTLDVNEAGKFLSRFGYPDAVKSAPTKIKGRLAWSGAPNDFDYPTLSGEFRIDVGAGRFMKVEPGLGKLLGVLSLQALPRRITLDFTDVFSEGFAFDEIKGDVRITNGVLMSDDLHLAGPAAKVDISGNADLAKETQQLIVRVQPSLSANVSAGAMLFLLANPLVGAAVGAGSLLAQKVLRDPIEQMFSYQYRVTGSWSDPVVASAGDVASVPRAEAPTR